MDSFLVGHPGLEIIFDTFYLTTVRLTAPFLTVLDAEERLRRSDPDDRFVIIGTDATEWSVAAVLYSANEAVRVQLPESIPSAISAASYNVGASSRTDAKGAFHRNGHNGDPKCGCSTSSMGRFASGIFGCGCHRQC